MRVHSLQRPPRGIDIPEAELPILVLATDLVEVRDRRQLGASALGLARALNSVSHPAYECKPELAVFAPSGDLVTALGTTDWGQGLRLYLGVDPRTERRIPKHNWTDVLQQIIDGPKADRRTLELAGRVMIGIDGVYEIETGEPLPQERRNVLLSGVVNLAVAQRGHGNEPIWPEAFAGQAVGRL